MNRHRFRLARLTLASIILYVGCERATTAPEPADDAQLASLTAELVRLEGLTTALTSPYAPMPPCNGAGVDTIQCRRDATLARIAQLREQSTAVRTRDDEGISSGPFLFHCGGVDGIVHVTYVRTEPARAFVTHLRSSIAMEIAPSASGARYTGAQPDQLFWEHQGVVRYREGAALPEVECRPDESR